VNTSFSLCLCVCVCVCARESKREIRGAFFSFSELPFFLKYKQNTHTHTHTHTGSKNKCCVYQEFKYEFDKECDSKCLADFFK